MPEQDGSATKPTAVMIGPVALAGVVLAVRAIRRRSYRSAVLAVGLFGVEAGLRPYRRLLRKGALRYSDSEQVSPRSANPDAEQPTRSALEGGEQ
jgi:hypothetical protein